MSSDALLGGQVLQPSPHRRGEERNPSDDTSGVYVWNSARDLLTFLTGRVGVAGLPGLNGCSIDKPLRALELGSGTGWLALEWAKSCPEPLHLLLTECAQGGALDRLTLNVELETHRTGVVGPCSSTVEIGELDWRSNEDALKFEGDLVFGSDLVYADSASKDLPPLLRRLLTPGLSKRTPICCLYAHPFPRFMVSESVEGDGEVVDPEVLYWLNREFDSIFDAFLAGCHAHNLVVEEVHISGEMSTVTLESERPSDFFTRSRTGIFLIRNLS